MYVNTFCDYFERLFFHAARYCFPPTRVYRLRVVTQNIWKDVSFFLFEKKHDAYLVISATVVPRFLAIFRSS